VRHTGTGVAFGGGWGRRFKWKGDHDNCYDDFTFSTLVGDDGVVAVQIGSNLNEGVDNEAHVPIYGLNVIREAILQSCS
jgi:hypothetical protein